PWLRDVAGLDRASVVEHLSVMAFAVCTSALLLGLVAKCLRHRGIKTKWVLAGVLVLSMAAQAALLVGCPLPSYLLWSQIAAAGAATVLSFAILTEYFPKELSGRANAALNLLHVGVAFLLQTGTGLIIAWWPQCDGGYPAEAHQTAMAALLGLEVGALGWFALSATRMPIPRPTSSVLNLWATAHSHSALGSSRLAAALAMWHRYQRQQERGWRLAAVVAFILCVSLTASLATAKAQPGIVVHLIAADRSIDLARR